MNIIFMPQPSTVHTDTLRRTGDAAWRLRRRPYLLAIVLVIVLCAVNGYLQPKFFRPQVIAALFTACLPLMFVATGQTLAVLGGSIDLSLGAIVSLVNVVIVAVAAHYGNTGAATWGAFVLGGLVGLTCGSINGLLISAIGLEPIIVTFGTGIIYSGLALSVMPQAGGSLNDAVGAFYADQFGGMPVIFMLLTALIVLCIWLSHTRFYLHLLAYGSQAQAAYQSGLGVRSLRVASHAAAGLMAAGAAMCVLGEAAAGDPLMGHSFTLGSVSAVVLGGTALAGGWGSLGGSMLGALIIALINNVVFFARLDYVYQSIVQGAIVLVALAGGVLFSRRPG